MSGAWRAAALGLALAAAGCALGPGAPGAPGRATASAAAPPAVASGELMREILESHPGLAEVVAAAPELRLQVVVGLVDERAGRPVLVQHGFRLGAEYFYPASAVKLFAAVAALERLAELRRETGLAVGPDTPLVFHPLFPGEEVESTDPSNREGGAITVRHEIRKLFLVSDNEAFNRLYELVGPDRLAASLARAGLDGRIVHRLEEARTPEENLQAPRIELVGPEFRYVIPEREAGALPAPDPVPGLEVGRAHLTGGEEVAAPFDFSAKNRFPLAELQRGLCMVVRPDVDCGSRGFALSDKQRALLLEPMHRYPRQSTNPVYDPDRYPDDYVKFLLPGLLRVVAEEGLAVYNKSGQAYGFTIDNAWIVDRAAGRSFFLAAVLYTNADGVVNDDRYGYDTVARPFFADLGEAAARRLWNLPLGR